MLSVHDIPGAHSQAGTLPKLADKTVGDNVVMVAPWKCKIRRVNVIATSAWAGVGSASNYNNLVLSTVINGTKVAVGTICGSVSGTPVLANTEAAVYAPASYPTLSEGDCLILGIGTVGAGSTAAPAFTTRAIFEGA